MSRARGTTTAGTLAIILSWSTWVGLSPWVKGQETITSPKEEFGFSLGDDYHLANYQQLEAYWRKLERESDRLDLEEIGRTAEGRTMIMAVLTSPGNHERLARYKEISRRLALADGLEPRDARALSSEGKAVVWIDGGLHATEVLGAQQLMALVYEMVSRNDPETLRILDDVILLAVCVNPDGLDLVADWYMREPEPSRRLTVGIPRLYQKYAGHDNNRDFYMSTQPETEAINRVLYLEWFPQIVYNHHQAGPPGTVLFAPPFRDPFNHYFDPLVPIGIDLVGAAMHSRFLVEGKPGTTMRSGANYSTWWNGGLRTTAYFHNMIGILTETIGSPNPSPIPFVPRRQLPSGDLPAPIAPQTWHFRQSVDYSMTANLAVMDVASKHREDFLFNIYRMGKNSIDRGSRDHWTVYPSRIEEVRAAAAKDGEERSLTEDHGIPLRYYKMFRDPAKRDARGYLIPAHQPDFLTATKFVHTLLKAGIAVERATADFEVSGRRYPRGSYVVKAAQSFRPHVLDMFEPQDHPNDIPYPGAPPRAPYDSAGWTLAYQMGVQFDRVLEPFDGPFERIEGQLLPPEGRVTSTANSAGYLLRRSTNDAFLAVNRLLARGAEVFWLMQPLKWNGSTYARGTIYIPANDEILPLLQRLAREVGLNFDAIPFSPRVENMKLRPTRIGLWDRYGGSMPSGWVRWLLEQFEFPFQLVYPPRLDAGGLIRDFDVLIFPTGAISEQDSDLPGASVPRGIPDEFRARWGAVTVSETIPEIRRFIERGGTVVAIGSSTQMAFHLDLAIESALVEKLPDGSQRPLQKEQYYVPGSILRVRVDSDNPLAHGIPAGVDVFFDNSPVFKLLPNANLSETKPVAWFADNKPLRSGWAWGQAFLEHGVAIVAAQLGHGNLFLFGPEITFRAQPHGTFKFLFNGILWANAE